MKTEKYKACFNIKKIYMILIPYTNILLKIDEKKWRINQTFTISIVVHKNIFKMQQWHLINTFKTLIAFLMTTCNYILCMLEIRGKVCIINMKKDFLSKMEKNCKCRKGLNFKINLSLF